MTDDTKKASIRLLDIALVLTAVFAILKACHVIAWSLLWVLAPLWLYFAWVLLIFLMAVFAAFIAIAVQAINKDKHKD